MAPTFGMPVDRSTAPFTIQLLVLDRIEPSHNMARYYVLTVEPTLFGDTALVREWGRIGTNCRRRLDLFVDEAAAKVALEIWLTRKTRRGYVVRSEAGPNAALL